MEEEVVDHAGTSVEETPNPQSYSVNRSHLWNKLDRSMSKMPLVLAISRGSASSLKLKLTPHLTAMFMLTRSRQWTLRYV